ncbi:hypothetical protein [Hamadaea tsunoensis]|uniref:hypothetical protein n=1 Tax=Hamadaea tsunoensis TaxID=53368 RepID=UPI0004091B36|nr:hypothetical protein [Hamadaea tsunoensis]
MVSFAGHAYPWDVLGDPAFPARVADAGLATVTLAAAYHTVRAATPLHPAHQLVDARHSALYRRSSVAFGRLRPLSPSWTDPDAFALAASALKAAGLRVNAWIVLTHNSALGSANPDLSVVNCFGERYPYALCPAHEEVRDYCANLATAALQDVAVDGVSLEACGQLGVVHMGHHEKTDDAWTADGLRALSVCCCPRCRSSWELFGASQGSSAFASSVVQRLQAIVRGEPLPLPPEVLAARHAHTDLLRAQVLDAVRTAAPGAEITLHGSPDPWATGPSPGLTPTAAGDVDAILVPAWPTTEATAALIRATRAAVEPAAPARPGLDAAGSQEARSVTVDAYLTVLPPAGADAVLPHARRLVDAGAQRLSLYHLGLAASWRQPLFAQITGGIS